MRGLRFIILFSLVFIPLLGFAKEGQDLYFRNYTPTEIWFLNQHYTEIDNGRHIRIDGIYQNHQWMKPYAYREQLKEVRKDIRDYNIIKISLRELDGVRYTFPIVLVWSAKGYLPELNELKKGRRIALYGQFFKMKDSEYALELHVMETIDKGGRKVELLLDSRIPPTPTPTVTPTPTPGPSLWQRIQKKLKPKVTPQPADTPGPGGVPATVK